MQNDRIIIFDTTLRDGEQSPGFSMNMDEKAPLRRPAREAGSGRHRGGLSPVVAGDFDAVRRISGRVKGAQVAGLARANFDDIDTAWEALKGAENPRIHTFISSSDIHIEYQLKKTRDQVMEQAVAAVKRACSYTSNVEFSPMDATRSDRDYLAGMVEAVIDAGAATVNIPDTVGYSIPSEFYGLIAFLFERVKNIHRAVISVHCHNDLGLAAANALAAIQAGARQVECTVNGIGERAGNTSLEEIVMAVKTRANIFNVSTAINTKQIMATSKLLTHITGVSVQPNKAIVGANAFAHESGIHQDGVLKNAMTYEIMNPEDVGIGRSNIVLGKHSGRHAVIERLKFLGYDLAGEELERFFKYFKALADAKKQIFDEDLEVLIGETVYKEKGRFKVTNVQISTGMFSPPMTLVTIKDRENDGAESFDVAAGNGGVDAGINAVKKITGTKARIEAFNLVAITGGSDALCEVTVTVSEEYEGKTLKVTGSGVNIDISVAGIFSFVDALNKMEYRKKVNGVRERVEARV